MPIKFAGPLRSAMAGQILTYIDAAIVNSGKVRFYTGTIPASMGGAIADTLLVEHTLLDPAGTVSVGVLTVTPPPDANGIADGNAGWCAILDGDDVEVCYLEVGLTGSNMPVEMNTVQVVTGVPVRVTAISFTISGM